jgi:RNA polymerase sigma factor (sigma-70 family)
VVKISGNDDLRLLHHFVESGSQEAFGQIVQQYVNLVYSVCLREVGDAALAEDVTQAVFLTLWQKAAVIGSGTLLAGWLFKTSRFAARNALRQEYRRKAMEREAAEREAAEAISQTVESESTWQSIEPLLNDALAALGGREREALLLRYFEDKSLKEVGVALGVSENTARMRVTRAIEKLKNILRKQGVAVPVAFLATTLAERAVQSAPASCAHAVGQLLGQMAIGSSTAVGAGVVANSVASTGITSTGVASTKAHVISQGVIKSMFINKLKVAAIVAGLGVTGVGGALHVAQLLPVGAAETGAKTSSVKQAVVANSKLPSGSAILQKSAAAYTALSTYNGSVSVRTDVLMNGNKSEYNGTANIVFTRPNSLHIDGLLAAGAGTYKIDHDGQTTTLEMVMRGKKKVSKPESAEMAVASATGVAAQAPTIIPALLMKFDWGYAFKDTKNARLEGQETIGTARCYKISKQTSQGHQTYWVDTKSFLLRQYKHDVSQAQGQKAFQSVPKKYLSKVPMPQSYSSTAVHTFTIKSAA